MSVRDRFPVLSYAIGKKYLLLRTFFYRKNPIKWTLKEYYHRFGVKLDLNNPVSFYEKMNYWKHFSYTKEQDILTDKIAVKKVLQDNGFGDLCPENFFETDNVKELKNWLLTKDIKKESFVIKTSHSCGDVFIFHNGQIIKKYGRSFKSVKQVLKILKKALK